MSGTITIPRDKTNLFVPDVPAANGNGAALPATLPDAALTPMEMLGRWVSYDAATGLVSWKSKPNRNIPIGRTAGVRWKDGRNTYIRIMIEGHWVFAHTLAFVSAHGRLPIGCIDHINGDGTDNRLSNLREVDHTTNLRNQRLNIRNKSGLLGVDLHRATGKWRARIIVDQTEHHLGTFDSYDEAARVRRRAERRFGFHPNHGRAS